MTDNYELTPDGFALFATEHFDATIKSEPHLHVIVQNFDEKKSIEVAELFVTAHDSDMIIGPFDTSRDPVSVMFEERR